MLVTVICGVSGCGKTWKRTHDPDLAVLPFFDIAHIYTELENDDSGLMVADSWTATNLLIKRVIAAKTNGVPRLVVEGYFLPGSPSRKYFDRAMRVQGIKTEYILLWAPLIVCSNRLDAQWDALSEKEQTVPATRNSFRIRRKLLIKCWKPQN